MYNIKLMNLKAQVIGLYEVNTEEEANEIIIKTNDAVSSMNKELFVICETETENTVEDVIKDLMKDALDYSTTKPIIVLCHHRHRKPIPSHFCKHGALTSSLNN